LTKAKQQLEAVPEPDALVADLWMSIGAINAVDSIAASLLSQTIRNLQRIRDQKLYQVLGFPRFEDLLDSPRSRISYAKFNRLEKAIENEGDALFDYLNAIDAPFTKRKLLGKGDVRVEGKEIIAQVGEEEIRVPLNNQTRILGVLSRVVEQRNEQARKIKRGEREVRALKDKVEDLKNSSGGQAGRNGFYDAVLMVIGAFQVLAAEAEKLPEDQRAAQRQTIYDTVAEHLHRVDAALGLKVPEHVKKRGVRVPKNLVEDSDD
jgi:hypothetical protein